MAAEGAGHAILQAIRELRLEVAAMEISVRNEIHAAEDRIISRIADLRAGAPASQAPAIASDADLDGQYGDEEVKKNPKRWTGESFIGRRMSECSPEFLDSLAGHFDYKAEREAEDAANAEDEETANAKKKYAGYSRRSAARARGWAARLRAGWKPPAPQGDSSTDGW